VPNLPEPIFDFTVALDKLIAELRASGLEPEAVSMSARRREQLRRACTQRGEQMDELRNYRGLPILTAMDTQSTVAAVAGGTEHLV
jgi:hypothetical protein